MWFYQSSAGTELKYKWNHNERMLKVKDKNTTLWVLFYSGLYRNGGLVGLYFGWIMLAPVVYSFMIWNENS